MNLRHLTDKVLLLDTKHLVAREREITLKLLHHLKEIERRRLFSDLGYGSLFEYIVKELGYSEPAASRRLHATRLLKDLPHIEKKIADGSLSLTNLSLAGQLFKNEDIQDPQEKKEILEKIENTTKRECEKELKKLVHSDLHVMKLSLKEETLNLFQEIRGVLAHKRFTNDEVMHEIFKIALPIIKNKKFKLNAKFTTPAALPSITRKIPNIIKKEVYERDGGRCTKCQSTFKLEYDHIKPFAMGGESTLANLRLLCFSCNQRRLKEL
ncbi:MAG: HNH endonuclease [Bacteriovoracaceae bacterium]|nr:HNH endonuclease [Bacteriovoracaceae bacterium]